MSAARDLLFALIPLAHRLDVRVSAALPILETTTRQLLAQEALLRWNGGFSITDFAEALGCTRPAARTFIEFDNDAELTMFVRLLQRLNERTKILARQR